jgi:hypothetical protein
MDELVAALEATTVVRSSMRGAHQADHQGKPSLTARFTCENRQYRPFVCFFDNPGPRLTAAVHLRQPKSLNEGSATIANRSSIEESRRWMSRMVTPLAPRPEVEE